MSALAKTRPLQGSVRATCEVECYGVREDARARCGREGERCGREGERCGREGAGCAEGLLLAAGRSASVGGVSAGVCRRTCCHSSEATPLSGSDLAGRMLEAA